MQVEIQGLFLLSGETAPIESRVARSIRARVRRMLCRGDAVDARLYVTIGEAISEDGTLSRHCRIQFSSDNAGHLVAEANGKTEIDALNAALDAVRRKLEGPSADHGRVVGPNTAEAPPERSAAQPAAGGAQHAPQRHTKARIFWPSRMLTSMPPADLGIR